MQAFGKASPMGLSLGRLGRAPASIARRGLHGHYLSAPGVIGDVVLRVRNLPHSATVEQVRRVFASSCDVRSIFITKDPRSGKSNGCANLTILTTDTDAVLLALEGAKVGGLEIEVRVAPPKKQPGPRKAHVPKLRPRVVHAEAAALNKQLALSESAASVLTLFEAKGHRFSAVNLANALHRLGDMSETFSPVCAALHHRLVQKATSSIIGDEAAWESREIAAACWGIAKVAAGTAPAFFEAAANAASKQVETLKPQEIANLVWSFATSKVSAPDLFQGLAEQGSIKVAHFSSAALASAVWAYAAAGAPAPEFFDAVAKCASSKAYTFSPEDLAKTAWAFASAGVPAPLLFEAFALQVPEKVGTLTTPELANVAWAFSTAGFQAPALFEAVAAEALIKIAKFNSQDVANVVWAFSNAGVEAPVLFEAAQAQAAEKVAMFRPQALANTVWAYATAGVAAPDLFEAVAATLDGGSTKKMATFDSLDLANTVWAFASAGVSAPALFRAVAAEASKKMATFEPQSLVNTVWAFSAAGVAAPALFDAVAKESLTKIETFESQELSKLVRAYATAGVAAPTLFEAVAAESSKKMATFKPQELANTVWAYSTAGIEAPALFEAVAAKLFKKIATLDSQALASIVWAYANAGVEAPALFGAVAAEALTKIATFDAPALANTAWAYAAAGVMAPALLEAMALSIEAKMGELSDDGLSQLHQASMLLRLEAPQHPLTMLLSRHEAKLNAAYLRQEPSPSRSQREVSAALFRIGWAHDFEHATAEGISLAMAQLASKVAVEFDDPTHYRVGSSDGVLTRVLDSKSKSKEQLLRRLGWTVVRVPYFEWDALSSADHDEYVRSKTMRGASVAESPSDF